MNYCIIGASAAGLNAAESIRRHDKKGEITIISDEKLLPYSRCLLSYLLAGKLGEDQLNFKPHNFLDEHKLIFRKGIKVQKILLKERKVILSDKNKIDFDRLLIATGSSPKIPETPGVKKEGVYPLRTLVDARLIMKHLDGVETAVILGGGLIGMRSAYALAKRGIKVKIVVKSEQVLSQAIDKRSAKVVQDYIEKKGIEVLTGTDISEISGKDEVKEVVLDSGERIKTGLVIIGKGVTPNLELAKEASIKVAKGVIINKNLETSAKGVFAAGDVAETIDLSTGESTINPLWPVAAKQGRLAGLNMAGSVTDYKGALPMNSLPLFEISLISIGLAKPRGEGFSEEIYGNEKHNLYRKFVFKDNLLVGAILMGKIENAGIFAGLIEKRVDISDIRNILTQDNFDYAKIMPFVKEHSEVFKEKEFADTVVSFQREGQILNTKL